MHLIDALVSGIRGAELGSVRLYRRGTSTPATWYADFEASSADSTGDAIELDSNGGATVFVNELVDVRVFDTNGTTVREFVSGHQAYAVEVISPSFTGTDYTSGASGISKPTNVGEVLDRWVDSAGAPDWYALYRGGPARIQDILGALGWLLYNVKSPEYGAEGDGTADDTAAFQAAHDAAEDAGGGIVVVPPGTYNISAALNWVTGVHLVCLPGTVIIRQITAATVVLSITSSGIANVTPTVVFGARFDSTVSNSAAQVVVDYATSESLLFSDCEFCASNNSVGVGISINSISGSSAAQITVSRCTLNARDSVRAINDTRSSTTGARLSVVDCRLSTPATAYSTELIRTAGNELNVRGCRFYFQGTSGTSIGVVSESTTHPLIVTDNIFDTSVGGASNYAVRLLASGRFIIRDNHINQNVTYYIQNADTDVLSTVIGLAQMRPHSSINPLNGSTGTIPDWIETYHIVATDTTGLSLTMPRVAYFGQVLRVVVKNGSGAAWVSPTGFNGTGSISVVRDGTTTAAPSNNDTMSYTFVACRRVLTDITWVQVGAFSPPYTS